MEDTTIESQLIEKPKLPVWARITLVMISFLILSSIFQALGFLTLGIPFSGIESINNFDISQLLVLESFGLTATLISVFVLRRFADKKSFVSLGLDINGKTNQIVLGFLIAFLIYFIGTLILYFTKQVEFTGYNVDIKTTLLSFILCFVIAVNEELLVRGYVLNNLLSTGKNKYVALTISALIFASMHSLNFNLTFLSIFNIFIAGLVLGSVYIFTQNLWFSISLHLCWNFLQGPILGYHVSGFNMHPLLIQKLPENNFINGGEFGFEGSILCTVITILLTFFIIKSYQNYSSK